MSRLFKLAGLLVLAFMIGISGMIVMLRRLDLPSDLQKMGFGLCNSKPCVAYSGSFTDATGSQVSLGWVVAWLGPPCGVRMMAFGPEFTFSGATVYTHGQADSINVTDPVWSITINRTTCDPKTNKWRGFAVRSIATPTTEIITAP